jgi:hypothetical protein
MSSANNWIHELDIADGLKQLLINAGVTLELMIGLDMEQICYTQIHMLAD